MENLALKIIEIDSYDDKDEDEKLKEIIELCHKEKENQTQILLLDENVGLDITAGNFDLDIEGVDREFYFEYYELEEEDIL